MKINRLSIFKNQLLFGFARACSFTYKNKFEQFLTWCFRVLPSFSYCWWRQAVGKDCLSFDRVYTSVYIFRWIAKSASAFYSLPCTQKSLFTSPCCFLDKVQKWFISKKAKLILISLLLLVVLLFSNIMSEAINNLLLLQITHILNSSFRTKLEFGHLRPAEGT